MFSFGPCCLWRLVDGVKTWRQRDRLRQRESSWRGNITWLIASFPVPVSKQNMLPRVRSLALKWTLKQKSPHSRRFICCQFLRCILTASCRLSCKYVHSKNNLTCQLFASGTQHLIWIHFFFFFNLNIFSTCLWPKILKCCKCVCPQ